MNNTVTAAEREAGILEKCWYDPKAKAWVCLVEYDKCKPDMTYQREHDDKHAERYSKRKLSVAPYPIVSYRANRLNTVDGQHRISGFIKRDEKSGYVIVKFGLTLAEEAKLYDMLNESKRPNAWNRFKTRLGYNDPATVEQYTMATEFGFTMKHEFRSKADLRNTHVIFEAYNANLYRPWLSVLAVFKDENGRLDKLLADGGNEFQRGVLDLIRKHPLKAATRKVLAALKQIGPGLIASEAKNICQCSRTTRNHFMLAMEEMLINRGLLPQRLRVRTAA